MADHLERLKSHTTLDPGTGCWLWTGGTNRQGYGKSNVGKQKMLSHRAAWIVTHGPIPAGMSVCHRCDVPACCNPDHLFLGTAADNVADRDRKGRTARGDRSGSRLHPDRLARGRRNGSRLHPERLMRGEQVNTAKVTADDVRTIRRLASEGVRPGVLQRRFGLNQRSVWNIVHRRTWRHVP